MLAKKERNQIREYVIGILPQLLREEPEITATIEGILAHQFPRRDEFARLLDEVKLLHEDMNRRFELKEQKFELMEQKLEAYREDTERWFEALHKEMNQRFEALHEEMNQRFEQVDKRFEALHKEMNQRFEQVDKRFEQVDQRFEEQHSEILDVKRRVIKIESGQALLLDKMTRFDMRLNMLAGTLGTEKGQRLEEVFASVLSYGLNHPDIKPESIQLRQQFVDTEGLVYLRKGKYIEVDIIAENGKFTVFEVKATTMIGNVDEFARKVKLIQLQNPDKKVRGIIISPWASEEVKQYCAEYDLELLD